MKKCPFCAESIKNAAAVCRYCQRDLPAPPPSKPVSKGLIIACVISGIVVVLALGVAAIFGDPQGEARYQRTPGPIRRSETTPRPTPVTRSVGSLYATTTVNIRSGPSATSNVIRRADANTKLRYKRKQGAWYLLDISPHLPDQWIHESVVREESPLASRTIAPSTFTPPSKVSKARQLLSQARQAGLLEHTKGRQLWVDPAVWGMFTYDDKRNFTYAAAVAACGCTDPNQFSVEIVNNMTGKKLAKWGLLGFKVY